MALVTDAELADLRSEQAASFDRTCTVSTPGEDVIDAGGGFSPGTPTTATVDCRVAVAGGATLGFGNESVQGDRIAGETLWEITLPQGTSVDDTSTVVSSGRTYKVVAVGDSLSFETARRVIARVVD